ncbi:MAG: FAD-dependent oxidoreductase [Oscillospiraceae bacterium]|nr:FAD-dependent oxidoreductase [Oscillospiraceae bacterium]
MEHKSFWQLEDGPKFSPLQKDITVNTAIIGSGICGLLCAYFLHQKGVRDIAVIDAGEVCGGVSANTTAKITSQHGLIYARLIEGLGEERAAQYLAANEKAVRDYREIITREQINCDFITTNAWIYTTTQKRLQDIEDELAAAQKLGVSASFDTKTELPFPVEGAIRFPNQAHFHPLKFAFRICDILTKAGCEIYTRAKATGAENGVVYTDRGNIRAEHIVSCSHYPFIDKHSLLFTKIYQDRSYLLALKGAGTIRDMYLDCENGGLSFRPQMDENNEDMILFGGYDHKTGHEDGAVHFDSLQKEAERCYPGHKTACMWSAQDCMTHDKIPYIGRYHTAGENIYLATGFNKWGMTSSMAAADIISDLITKGDSGFTDAFSLNRGDIGLQAKSFIKQTADIAGNFLTHLTMADKRLQTIHNNEGGIVESGGKRVGIYKDISGHIHAVKPVCTHMGCAIKWNKDENTWDCTCHGSRFDYQGNVVGGPALKPLERLEFQRD